MSKPKCYWINIFHRISCHCESSRSNLLLNCGLLHLPRTWSLTTPGRTCVAVITLIKSPHEIVPPSSLFLICTCVRCRRPSPYSFRLCLPGLHPYSSARETRGHPLSG